MREASTHSFSDISYTLCTDEFDFPNHNIPLYWTPELFTPNMTSKQIAKSVDELGPTIFDIGAGVNPLSIWAALESPSSTVYSVEANEEQTKVGRLNAHENNVQHRLHIYHGSLFEPLPEDLVADTIIGDVSGVASAIARIMKTTDRQTKQRIPWYPEAIPDGGPDGTDNIVPLIERGKQRLNPDGALYFPASSLSSYKKIFDTAEQHFGKLEEKVARPIPLEPAQGDAIRANAPEDTYEFTHKGSRDAWMLWVYKATDPR